MTTKPDYVGGGKTILTVPRAWNRIIDGGYLYADPQHGWINREGKVFSCNFASHELLLHWLDTDVQTVEQAGWVRFSNTKYQCLFRISRQQKKVLNDLGLLVDGGAERLKSILKK